MSSAGVCLIPVDRPVGLFSHLERGPCSLLFGTALLISVSHLFARNHVIVECLPWCHWISFFYRLRLRGQTSHRYK